MACKSVTKRARVDASSSRDDNKITAASQSMTAAGDADHRTIGTGVDEEVVGRLRMELETATKCIEQLRREKDYEVRQVRDQEQNRSSTAMKELESRLKNDCRREVERTRETIKSRFEADTTRLVGRYERTVNRLSNDLDRCRNELREEIEKRGMSSTTRGGFETERCRLLAEVRDLKAAKRRLEESIESAAEVDKQKTAELKRTQEACKAEVAKVSKEATAEIRKLLEELKAKDHQLALLDRNQYSDRGVSLPKHPTVENVSKEVNESMASKPVKPVATGEVSDNNSCNKLDSVKITKLEENIEKLNVQLAASEADRTSMKVRLDELSGELVRREETIAGLRKSNDTEQPTKQSCIVVKNTPKAVRFLLPGCTSPVLAREIELIDNDSASICSDDLSCGSSSSIMSDRLSPDTTVLYDENIEKNYQLLLTEHLSLERSISLLVSSLTPSLSSPAAASSSEVADSAEDQSACNRKECVQEKDIMKNTIMALKEKHAQYEQSVYQLQQQLREKSEQYEDLEFHAFELEECAENCKMAHSITSAEDLLEKTRSLEVEMSTMKRRLDYYNAIETDIDLCAGLDLRQSVALIKNQLNEAESQSAMSRLEAMALRKSLEEITKCQLNTSTTRTKQSRPTIAEEAMGLLIAPEMTIIDGDDSSLCAMNSSMSTTSGFDDDDSCASSVADLRLEEMPSEETWGFDEEDAYHDQHVESSKNPCITEGHQGSAIRPIVVVTSADCGEDLTQLNQVNAARQSDDEDVWLARIETFESRLTQAIQSEQRARDQAALLAEEKDRRIVALQEQVDLLEANEFRLSETIRSLERLEQTFGFHLLSNVEKRISSTSSSSSKSNNSVADTATVIAADADDEERNRVTSVDSPVESDDVCFPFDEPTGVDELKMREMVSENRFRYETSAMLRASLEKLRQAEAESANVDRKIKELVEVANDDATVDEIDSLVFKETSNGWNVSAQIVNFESEYRELEGLIKELKKVLVLEKELMGSGVAANDTATDDAIGVNNVTKPSELMIAEADYVTCTWMTGSVSYSLPGTPEFEMPPSTNLTMDRSLEFELTEKCLIQQIKNLELDREALREALLDDESTLRELGVQLVELQASETSLKDEVSRLKAKEDWMISRNSELMELVGRLEESVKSHRVAEIEMRSRCERHCAEEAERGRELEYAHDEQRAVETRYRRWIAQLDDEKVQLQSLVDDMTEKNSDLEGREAGLLCRIRKLEAAEFGLRNEVADLERMLNETTDERDGLLMQISDKDEDERMTSAIPSVDGWTQCDDVVVSGENDDYCRRLEERAEFFKEMLEFTEQSYAALESRLVEYATSEVTLRSTLAEYEKTDKLSAERVELLEADNSRMAKRIVELETSVADMKTRFHHQFDNDDRSKPGSEELTNDSDFFKVKQEATSALRNIMLLNVVADEMNDTEVMFWAAVENAQLSQDTETETDLSSPIWTDVEERMGLDVKAALKVDDRKRVHELSLALNPEPPSKKSDVISCSSNQHPPPLPLSPPPTLPDRVDKLDSSVGSSQRLDQQGVLELHPRSQSADLFSSKSIELPSDENRWNQRASSETRDPETHSTSAWYIKESNAELSRAYHKMDQSWHHSSPSSAAKSAGKDPVMERILKSREFWSARSLSVPDSQIPVSDTSTNQHSRPSLIPRIAVPLRTTPVKPLVKRSVSEYGAPNATHIVTMPVIRSTPSPHLSPRLTDAELDDKKNNRSYIPRPIGENRSINAGSDTDNSDNTSQSAKPKVTQQGRPGQGRTTAKIYTTVLNPNRYATPKFSYLSGSSQNKPHAARSSVTDSKTSPTSSFATGTNQVWRPAVVSSTTIGSEVHSLPGSRA